MDLLKIETINFEKSEILSVGVVLTLFYGHLKPFRIEFER